MRECLTCGQHYKYCPNCGKDEKKPLYFESYCSENCKDIFDIATEYYFGHISKTKAQSDLSKCDMSKLESFRDSVKRDVKKILEPDAKSIDSEAKEVKSLKYIK